MPVNMSSIYTTIPLETNLYIKNMVCDRCIMVVRQEIEKLGLPIRDIKLGEVRVGQEVSTEQRQQIKSRLESLGFQLIDDKKNLTVERIKTSIIKLIYSKNLYLKTNLSKFLSEELHQDYQHLTHLFSEVEGTTIEKYFIAQKIERVKELLDYGELTLSEIANELNYSSVAYLSNQFKKVTGLTPSEYKRSHSQERQALDRI